VAITDASGFTKREQARQNAYFESELVGMNGYRGAAHRLLPSHKVNNLAPSIRDLAGRYFGEAISWHLHANHGLSSQVCCLNFLMPLVERPKLLARLIGATLEIAAPEMLPVEIGPDGRPWFVGFEWIGGDYLNESIDGKRRRGANCTSADAVVRFRQGSVTETLLIEWKYTESYGPPLSLSGNETRTRRYKELVFHPNGPIRHDQGLTLEDFFWEPFYQLLRQKMLAFQMQKHGEDGASRVRVLHIAPAANLALKKVTSSALRRFGDNAFTVFRSLLVRPDDFVSRSTEELFGLLVAELGDKDDWSAYLNRRYAFLADATATIAGNS
jgi:hypothetical protein